MRLPLVCVVLLMLHTAPASAEQKPPDSSKPRRVKVTLLDSVSDVRGGLLDLTSEAVIVMVDGMPVKIPLTTVRRVEIGGDSVLNGAIAGGVVVAVWCALVCGQGLGERSSLPAAVIANTWLGALIGAGIDAMYSDRVTLYDSRSRQRRMSGAAVTLTVRF